MNRREVLQIIEEVLQGANENALVHSPLTRVLLGVVGTKISEEDLRERGSLVEEEPAFEDDGEDLL